MTISLPRFSNFKTNVRHIKQQFLFFRKYSVDINYIENQEREFLKAIKSSKYTLNSKIELGAFYSIYLEWKINERFPMNESIEKYTREVIF